MRGARRSGPILLRQLYRRDRVHDAGAGRGFPDRRGGDLLWPRRSRVCDWTRRGDHPPSAFEVRIRSDCGGSEDPDRLRRGPPTVQEVGAHRDHRGRKGRTRRGVQPRDGVVDERPRWSSQTSPHRLNLHALSWPMLLRARGSPLSRKSVLTSKIEVEVKLLERHVQMLQGRNENQPIGIIRLSEMLNVPQHKVRYSLRILEQEGLIKPSPEGAVTTDRLEEFLDYLKSVLDMMSSTVQELRKSLG